MTSNATNMSAELDQLIRIIYSTSLNPSKWTLVLEKLRELAERDGIKSSSLTWLGKGGAPSEVLSSLKDALAPKRHRHARRRRLDDAGDAKIFRLLDEHVRQAMQITEKISTINHQQLLLQQAFDRLSDAIFFLGQGNSILIANRAAYALTKADDGLRTQNGRTHSNPSPDSGQASCARDRCRRQLVE